MEPTLTNDIAEKKPSQIDSVRGLLEKMKGQLASALPRTITPEKMIRIAITSCQKTPALLDCSPVTLLGAIMQSAQLGLVPDGILGEAYLIPYENKAKGRKEVQFQIGYKGLKKLVHNSGEIDTFLPQVVYEGDLFEYSLADARINRHERTSQSNYGNPTHFYTIVKYKSGTQESLVMTKGEIDHIRDKFSQGYRTATKYKREDTPWIQHYEAMAMKTVMRKHAKYLPVSTEAAAALALDERAEAGLPQDLGSLIDPNEKATVDTTASNEPPIQQPVRASTSTSNPPESRA